MAAVLSVLCGCTGGTDEVEGIEVGDERVEPTETRRTMDERAVHEYLAERHIEPEDVNCGNNTSPAATVRGCSAVTGETLYRLEVDDDGVVRCLRGDLMPDGDELEMSPTCG